MFVFRVYKRVYWVRERTDGPWTGAWSHRSIQKVRVSRPDGVPEGARSGRRSDETVVAGPGVVPWQRALNDGFGVKGPTDSTDPKIHLTPLDGRGIRNVVFLNEQLSLRSETWGLGVFQIGVCNKEVEERDETSTTIFDEVGFYLGSNSTSDRCPILSRDLYLEYWLVTVNPWDTETP